MSARAGFTLIELLVVIVVLAILMAIAIPTLLNQRKKAWDKSAQSDVMNAYKAMKASYTDGQAYTPAALVEAASSEPQITMVAAGMDAYRQDAVSYARSDDQTIVLTKKSKSGRFFCLLARESGAGAKTSLWQGESNPDAGCPTISAGSPTPPGGGGSGTFAVSQTSGPSAPGMYPGSYSTTFTGAGATPSTPITVSLGMGMGVDTLTVTSSTVNGDGTWSLTVSYNCASSGSGSSVTIGNDGKTASGNVGCGGSAGGTPPPPTGGGMPAGPPTSGGTGTPIVASTISTSCDSGYETTDTPYGCTQTMNGSGAQSAPSLDMVNPTGAADFAISQNVVNADGTWSLVVSYTCAAPTISGSTTYYAAGGSISISDGTASTGMGNIPLNCSNA